MKFADNTVVVGLISQGDESTYRDVVATVALLVYKNHLPLNEAQGKSCALQEKRRSFNQSTSIAKSREGGHQLPQGDRQEGSEFGLPCHGSGKARPNSACVDSGGT